VGGGVVYSGAGCEAGAEGTEVAAGRRPAHPTIIKTGTKNAANHGNRAVINLRSPATTAFR
jgi:hypothetical protein